MRFSCLRALLILTTALPVVAKTEYTVAYTGRAFGYYRIPDVQRASGNVCAASAIDLEQVRAMLRQISGAPGSKVLVSLGDNFAPDLHARSVEQGGALAPKDQLTFDYVKTQRWVWYSNTSPELDQSLARGEGVLDFDNVACFFRLAGFDAMVPGKHDFHFGPERLRELARYLTDAGGPGKPVQMLAANLAIGVTVAHPPAQTEPAPKPRNYAMGGPNGSRIALPGVALPYVREFDITNGVNVTGTMTSTTGHTQLQRLTSEAVKEPGEKAATKLYEHAWFCPGALEEAFKPGDCVELTPAASRESTLVFELPLSAYGLYPGPTAVKPGVDYHVCASATADAAGMSTKNTICQGTFQFHHPFFQWGSGKQPNPGLYAVVADQPVVVFGVVDPALLTQIGDLNSSWLNEDARFDTRLEIIDPHAALNQALQTCKRDPVCAGKRRVLLAQMPAIRAQRLAAHLGDDFDLVIAQADEGDSSGSFTRDDRSPDGSRQPLLLTPASNASTTDPEKLRVTLQTAHVIDEDDSSRTIENTVHRETVSVAQGTYTGEVPLWRLIVNAGLAPAPASEKIIDGRTIVQNGILSAMQKYCRSDVAFLQHRDLFRPEHYAIERPTAGELQDLLDRLLWKGDFIECHPITGGALKQAKASSDEFSSEPNSELDDRGEQGRWLATLGMLPEGPDLVVSGAVAQDQRLYTVATTDYLAQGETGYPALHQLPVPRRERIVDTPQFQEIAALFCRQLIGGIPGANGAGLCRGPLEAETYLDPIAMQPYSLPRGASDAEKLRNWARSNWKTKDLLLPAGGDKSELAIQNRRVLSLRLDKADLGFQRNLHSLNEAQQQQRFGGVQAPEPTAPERFDWTSDYLLRLTSYSKDVDLFIQTDAQYESSGVRQTFQTVNAQGVAVYVPNEPYQLSLPENAIGVEAGMETRLIPAHRKNTTGLRLLTSVRFDTELQAPFIQFQASDGFVKETLPRRNSLFGKAGLRYDGPKSWLEMGMESGPFTQISALSLGGLTCDPGNLQLCLSTSGAVPAVEIVQSEPFRAITARREQSGVFLNARLHVPVPLKNFDYVIDNSGNLYFNSHGDSAADTRYLETMTHSLTIPVIGNFSIVPKVEIFFFQNQVAGWHIHGYQTSVTAQYRFDWHSGLHWGDAFRYPSPPTAQ